MISNTRGNLSLKSLGHQYMYYQSKIIVGIFSYLQDRTNKQIEDLFSYAVDLFNALGSWIYGGASPKIVYPVLQLFVKKANLTNNKSFSDLLEYINWLGNSLFKILKDNELIESYYYESFTLRQSNNVTTGLLFMWRIGCLNEILREKVEEDDIKILLQVQVAHANLFDAFGKWIYHQEEIFNITQSLEQLENLVGDNINPTYEDLLEETSKTCDNVSKFLQRF
ncbi:MAG: hypothetical protein EAX91_17670 [Candidatus Lokiarchaeota archaeon]|nr:hypothetical protein [Candidatus Lokiarchaeota archaeon]